MTLTHDRVKEVLSYNPQTGAFSWLVRRGNASPPAGSAAGVLNSMGYWQIKIDGRAYLAHRLAWLWMMGDWPVGHIDHKNGDRSENKWENLRQASVTQNHANRKVTNPLGLKGVRYRQKWGKYEASITVNRKWHYLGAFSSAEEASMAYAAAAGEHFGEFANAIR